MTGSREHAPPERFMPPGWVNCGTAEVCDEHAHVAAPWLAARAAWWARRKAWMRENPPPLPPWEQVGLDDPDTEPP